MKKMFKNFSDYDQVKNMSNKGLGFATPAPEQSIDKKAEEKK